MFKEYLMTMKQLYTLVIILDTIIGIPLFASEPEQQQPASSKIPSKELAQRLAAREASKVAYYRSGADQFFAGPEYFSDFMQAVHETEIKDNNNKAT
jgi:hypothetical protein